MSNTQIISFYRGIKDAYAPEHASGIYFATDTGEIIHNGKSYSGLLEVGKSVQNITLVDGVMTITYTDSSTTTVEIGSGKYQSNIEDKDLAMPNAVGGIAKNTKLSALEGKTYDAIFDDLLFPTVNPTFTNVSASISLKSGQASTREVGSAAPAASDFSTSYSAGQITLNGTKQANRGGAHDTANSFIYYGSSAENTTLPTTVSLGNTSYKYRAAYAEGPQPKDNKGNNYSSPLAAGTVDSSACTVNGTYPWFASTATASAETPVVKQALVAWNATAGNMSTGEFEVQASGNLPQVIKLPRAATQFQIYSNGTGKWETESIQTKYETSTEEIEINGNKVTYSVYTYKAASLGNRGAAKLTIKF